MARGAANEEVVAAASEPTKDVAEEKAVVPLLPLPEERSDDSKALTVAGSEKTSKDSAERDAFLARVEAEKRISLIKAWEENEKAKAENKAAKTMTSIAAWENSMKAALEAELKMKEEELEKKKAERAEKMRNKLARAYKAAEEKRAMTEARRAEEIVKAEEKAAKYRATTLAPRKLTKWLGI